VVQAAVVMVQHLRLRPAVLPTQAAVVVELVTMLAVHRAQAVLEL
jgi:hypothetical protein